MKRETRYAIDTIHGEVYAETPQHLWSVNLECWRKSARKYGHPARVAAPMPVGHLMFSGKVGDTNGRKRRISREEAEAALDRIATARS